MSRQPVIVSPRAFEEGMTAGALKRTRRAADVYANAGDYDSASRAVFQTDPDLSQRYTQERTHARERAEDVYQSEVAPMIARGDYQGAVDLAGTRGRPMQEILNIRQQMRTAHDEQVAAMAQQMESQTRALVGIGEMAPAEQQNAYTQWRLSLPTDAQANVPEQFSIGFVRRRLHEAMTIQQIIADESQRRTLGETERHNRAMEGVAASRAASGGQRQTVLAGAEQRGRIILSFPSVVQSQRDMDRIEMGSGRSRQNPYNANNGNRAAGTARNLPGIGNSIASWTGDDTLDAYRTAANTFEQSIIPAFAGSAVTLSEAQRFVRANVPALDDSPAVLAQKARNRQMITNQAAVIIGAEPPFPSAGFWTPSGGMQSVEMPSGDTSSPREGEVQDGYRFLGGDPADPGNWEPE